MLEKPEPIVPNCKGLISDCYTSISTSGIKPPIPTTGSSIMNSKLHKDKCEKDALNTRLQWLVVNGYFG